MDTPLLMVSVAHTEDHHHLMDHRMVMIHMWMMWKKNIENENNTCRYKTSTFLFTLIHI